MLKTMMSAPLRVKLAGVSLVALTVASAMPFLSTNNAEYRSAPLTTASVGSVETADGAGEQIQELPPGLDQMEASTELVDDEVDSEVRKVLPESDPILTAPVNANADDVAPIKVNTPEDAADTDMMVEPVMDAAIDVELDDTMPGADMMQAEAVPSGGDVMDEMAMQALAPSAMSPQGVVQGADQPPMVGNGITVALDHARVMKVVGDVSTIIIGNPAIADATMPDPGTIVLTGKSFGETNMVMLDPMGNIVAEQILQVTSRGENMVSVYRGVQRTTLSCSPICEIRPTPGDTAEVLEAGLSAFEARNAAAVSAATGQ